KFSEQNDRLRIKGGFLEGEFLDQMKVKDLANLPSRTELQAKLLSIMQLSAGHLLRLIQEPGARVVRLLEMLRKGKAASQ
ncbi:MAG: 50S ribosomal protein L10, partial [Deltaproteobacteria bacterium]|nr:50S ribosomal protein L10 [Deltaproteobacteria bacterium]